MTIFQRDELSDGITRIDDTRQGEIIGYNKKSVIDGAVVKYITMEHKTNWTERRREKERRAR